MKVDGVDFAKGFVEGFKSEKDFIAEMAKAGYAHIYQGAGRTEKLKEAYHIHHPKKSADKK
jgi:hypothetical protein